MSSSEPRLMVGDGLGDARATPLIGPQGSVSTAADSSKSATVVSKVSAPAGRRTNPGANLPPLFSLSNFVFEAPPWLFSAGLHLITVIILGLLIFSPRSAGRAVVAFRLS